MDCLQVDIKNVTTRAVCGAFDNASFDKNKRVYKNIRKSLPFADNMFENDETKSTDTVISNLKEKLGECKAKAKNMTSNIMTIVEQGSSDNTFIKAMLQLYNKEIEQISIISEAIDAEYEKELKFLLEKRDNLSSGDSQTLVHEWDCLSRIVDKGIRRGESLLSMNITDEIFENLQVDFEHNCPLLTSVVRTLFSKDASNRKEKGTIHALCLLMSLRNNQCRNDITLFFTMLLISYGAGNKMVNMLNKIGLTVHWDTMMNFLDKQLVVNEKYVQSRTPLNMPLLFLMDNINIYRGNQHHHRLFKAYQENMWNFTGQGILIPNIDGIEDLFLCEDTSLESQHDVIKFTSDDITLQHYPEMEKIWSEHKDNYLLKLLEDGINCASNAQKPFKDTV